jgi:hypothetical protein
MFFIKYSLLILLLIAVLSNCQQDGWKMTDRFYGFRYEITGKHLAESGFENHIVNLADEYGCFGWVQKTKGKTYVGEARCSKLNGPRFEEKLKYPFGSKDHETKILVSFE